jgi:hypothetical protein
VIITVLSLFLHKIDFFKFFTTAFTKKLATEKEWDAIIIGSGIGGLIEHNYLCSGSFYLLLFFDVYMQECQPQRFSAKPE